MDNNGNLNTMMDLREWLGKHNRRWSLAFSDLDERTKTSVALDLIRRINASQSNGTPGRELADSINEMLNQNNTQPNKPIPQAVADLPMDPEVKRIIKIIREVVPGGGTINDVAKKAGISAQTIYNRKNKHIAIQEAMTECMNARSANGKGKSPNGQMIPLAEIEKIVNKRESLPETVPQPVPANNPDTAADDGLNDLGIIEIEVPDTFGIHDGIAWAAFSTIMNGSVETQAEFGFAIARHMQAKVKKFCVAGL